MIADDMGYGDVGYNGGVTDTPNIDKLAETGVVLSKLLHESAVCPEPTVAIHGASGRILRLAMDRTGDRLSPSRRPPMPFP